MGPESTILWTEKATHESWNHLLAPMLLKVLPHGDSSPTLKPRRTVDVHVDHSRQSCLSLPHQPKPLPLVTRECFLQADLWLPSGCLFHRLFWRRASRPYHVSDPTVWSLSLSTSSRAYGSWIFITPGPLVGRDPWLSKRLLVR